MEEHRQRRKQIIAWVLVVLAFWGITAVLSFQYLSNANKEAVKRAGEILEKSVYTWSSQIYSEINSCREIGSILSKDGLSTKENQELARELISKTQIEHIYQVKGNSIILGEDGKPHSEYDLSKVLESDEIAYFIDNFGPEFEDVVLTKIYLGDNTGFLLFQINEAYLEQKYFEGSMRELSFLSVADKLGNICITFDAYRDRTSKFFEDLNFLNNICQDTANADNNGIFRSGYLSGVNVSIISEYKNDKRLIVSCPIGKSGYSLIYGIRYAYAETLIEGYYKNSKDVLINILMAFAVFSIIVVTTSISSTLRYKEKGKELANKADTDLLTELNNKLATERKIKEYIEEHPDQRCLFFILDIDNFKKINDTMGHAFGDTLLKTLGKELKSEFRASDIIGRTGGDEFILFLKNINDDVIIEREASRLIRFFHDFKAGGDYVKYSASASIGAAIYPDNGKDFSSLYVAADQALYRAKKRGKNQLCFYDNREI